MSLFFLSFIVAFYRCFLGSGGLGLGVGGGGVGHGVNALPQTVGLADLEVEELVQAS